MRKGVIGAGNWIVDTVKTIDRWPGEGNLCNVLKQELAGGGGPCNVLFDLAAMDPNLPLYAVGTIGDDKAGDFLMDQIRARNIDATAMTRSTELPTSYTDVMSGEGKRTFFHCRGANALLDYDHAVSTQAEAKIFYLGYLLLLDGLDQADPDYGTVGAHVLKTMQERGYFNVVDFVSEAPEKFRRVVKAALPYIDALVINELEAGNTFDLQVRRDDDTLDMDNLKKCCQNFIDSGVKLVVIHYPEGALSYDAQGQVTEVPSIHIDKKDIVGTNGAGDAFCAGVVYGLHENYPMADCLRLGSASSFANLHSAGASTGARPLQELLEAVKGL